LSPLLFMGPFFLSVLPILVVLHFWLFHHFLSFLPCKYNYLSFLSSVPFATVSPIFWFIPLENPDDILTKIQELVTIKLPEERYFHPFDEIQVLSPMKKGVLGTLNINIALQDKLNPSLKRVTKMGRTFRLGDKVMQVRNNYDKLVFNGDVGRIVEIDEQEEEIVALFDGQEVVYNFTEMDELILAYAVSVHKYQGSECPVILMPIHTSHFKLLVKNLVYTGITRGKKLVILVGSKRAIAIAVKSVSVEERFTGLKHFLKENLKKTTPPSMELKQETLFEDLIDLKI
jgi:exodeoxyribonuclease V alpha subunit